MTLRTRLNIGVFAVAFNFSAFLLHAFTGHVGFAVTHAILLLWCVVGIQWVLNEIVKEEIANALRGRGEETQLR